MEPISLQRYLHEHIPLSQAMGAAVREASLERVTLSAPLAPNINHRDTVFGGSASAVAILSAWALLYLRLTHERLDSRVVIQRNTMVYERPIIGDFTASSVMPAAADWQRFIETLKRKRRARISVGAVLHCGGEEVGKLEGDFVALMVGT